MEVCLTIDYKLKLLYNLNDKLKGITKIDYKNRLLISNKGKEKKNGSKRRK